MFQQKHPTTLISLLLFLFLLSTIDGAVYSGQFKTFKNWNYLAKFCFSNEFGGVGTFTYNIQTSSNTLQLMLYLGVDSSVPGSWDAAYSQRDKLTCQQLVDLHRHNGMAWVESGETARYNATQSVRAYFWYVAVADCTVQSISIDSYNLQFINPGGFWYQQFSYDEQGVVQYYLYFISLYVILMAIHIWTVFKLIRMEAWHPIVRILTVAITFQFLAALTETIHYCIYLNDGIGANSLKVLGELLTMAAQLLLMFLCVLVAKGWAITTSRLTDRNLLIVTMALFLLAYLALFIWDNVGRDPASTLYFYDSIPGLVVLLLRIGITVWFLWCLRGTIGLEALPDKRRFYAIFGFCFTIWFLLLPAIVALHLS